MCVRTLFPIRWMGDYNRRDRSELHRIAASERRRIVLAALLETSGWVSVEDVASRIANRTERPTASDDRRSTIEIELVHCHLPLLDDAELIEFDRERRRLRARDELECVPEMLLETDGEPKRDASDRA